MSERETPRRALFRCEGCEMELYLLAPVERACPGCGGHFKEIDEEYEYNSVELGLPQLIASTFDERAATFDEIIEREMPAILEGFEELLSVTSKRQGWG